MKIIIVVIILILSSFSNSLFSQTDFFKPQLVIKKKCGKKKVIIKTDDKIKIILNDSNLDFNGWVSNITDSSIFINDNEIKFSEVNKIIITNSSRLKNANILLGIGTALFLCGGITIGVGLVENNKYNGLEMSGLLSIMGGIIPFSVGSILKLTSKKRYNIGEKYIILFTIYPS